MIDLEKEEFLRRLDIRLGAISGLLAFHEKHIAMSLCDSRQLRDFERHIDNAQQDFIEYIAKTDKEIREYFEKLKAE